MSGAGGTRLWALVARAYWRRARRRLRSGLLSRWRFSGRTPERILLAPPDLRTVDPQIATEIYYGRFPLAGHLVDTGGRSPFQLDVANPGWLAALHGFRWMRHFRAAGTELAAANARALVSDWIAAHGRVVEGLAWEPETVARRVIAWLQHSSVVLEGAELPFYRAYLRSLAVQVRFLRAAVRDMPAGESLLRARIALAFAALSLPVSQVSLRNATRNLADELDRQILADGGHVSRDSRTLLELLADLLPLRQTYAAQPAPPPRALIGAVERMLPALRFFRHRDGSLARFNGMGATFRERVAAVLRHDDTGGKPLLHAPHSGYERLALGATTVIADTGAPPPADVSGSAHAGCLSFELSSDRQSYVVNAGVDAFGADEFRLLARATAAHSTAVLNDTSSGRFSHSARTRALVGAPLVGGPQRVTSDRLDRPDRHGFVASHDGYLARFGLLHERELTLSDGGDLLEGADRVFRPGGAPAKDNGRDLVSIRFHVHPDVNLYRDERDRLVLAGQDGRGWLFACREVKPSVDDSIFFAGSGGPRRTRQIVLSYAAHLHSEVRWRMRRVDLSDAAEKP